MNDTTKLSVADKVKKVNEILKKSEPTSISKDDYSGYTGYKPQYIVDSMNGVFGIGGWGFDELETHTVDIEKGKLAVSNVRVWIKADTELQVAFTSWGQSRVTRGDLGDAKKGAQTDAIKKALSYFSIGNRAYHGLL